jgi:hypothetical protein
LLICKPCLLSKNGIGIIEPLVSNIRLISQCCIGIAQFLAKQITNQANVAMILLRYTISSILANIIHGSACHRTIEHATLTKVVYCLSHSAFKRGCNRILHILLIL